MNNFLLLLASNCLRCASCAKTVRTRHSDVGRAATQGFTTNQRTCRHSPHGQLIGHASAILRVTDTLKKSQMFEELTAPNISETPYSNANDEEKENENEVGPCKS